MCYHLPVRVPRNTPRAAGTGLPLPDAPRVSAVLVALVTLIRLAACSPVGVETADTAAPDCFSEAAWDTSASSSTLAEARAQAAGTADLLLVEEARCGDGRTEFSVQLELLGFVECYSPEGRLVGGFWWGDTLGEDGCTGRGAGTLCDCNGDDYPVAEPDDGQCFSMLDCGEHCWTLDELREWCEMFEHSLAIPDDYTREWTCDDGRVEYDCPFERGSTTYCFAPTGELLGMYDARDRTDTCEDYEGELCDCSGDGQPEGAE